MTKIFNLFVIAAVTVLCACGPSKNNMQPTKIPLVPEILTGKITKLAYSPDRKDSMESKLAYAFYATPKFPWQDSVNYHVGKFASESTEVGEGEYVHKSLSHEFFYERLYGFVRKSEEDNKDNEYPMLWNYEGSISIKPNLKDFVQLEMAYGVFTGGAHPNYFAGHYLISKADGRTQQLGDLVSDVAKFNRIAEKHFRNTAELSPNADLDQSGYWFADNKFACNNNFTITPSGITFLFNAYEIGPYAIGSTEFTVPMAEVKDLLLVDFSAQ